MTDLTAVTGIRPSDLKKIRTDYGAIGFTQVTGEIYKVNEQSRHYFTNIMFDVSKVPDDLSPGLKIWWGRESVAVISSDNQNGYIREAAVYTTPGFEINTTLNHIMFKWHIAVAGSSNYSTGGHV